MPETQAVYYRDARGREPVDAFLEALRPSAAQIDGALRELRCHYGKRLFRVLYQRSGNLFVLLHVIEKTTGAVPVADIALAKSRFADFQARMGADPRVPPRPAGHDAPARGRSGPA